MTYSCADFTEAVCHELLRLGAIHASEAENNDLDDNPVLNCAQI